MPLADVEDVTELLKGETEDSEKEARLVESIVVEHSKQYEFISSDDRSSRLFRELFHTLVERRLLSPGWTESVQRVQLLRVLQAVRLLTRDPTLRRCLADGPAVQVVTGVLEACAKEHFSARSSPYQVEVITECASIVKRLSGDSWGITALVQARVHTTLLQLLGSTDPAVLPPVLVALLGYAQQPQYYTLVAGADSLELLLRVVQQYELPFKRHAAEVLAALARHQELVEELLAVNALGRVVGQLQSGDSRLLQALLRMLCHMASRQPAAQEMYQVGVVPILLALLGGQQLGEQQRRQQQQQQQAEQHQQQQQRVRPLSGDRLMEVQLVCTALTRLAEALDDVAHQMCACNAVFLLGGLLLQDLMASAGGGATDAAGDSDSRAGVAAHALRALRYVFSVERSRRLFKRLFPPRLFSIFIDIGHYNPNLQPYASLVECFQELGQQQLAAVGAALEEINMDREGGYRVVHGYEVLELLGRGAFGAVYKARRPRAEALVALKELPLMEEGLFGASDAERRAGAGRMSREVEILSSLHHPNVVQYYESFVEGQQMYIVMELVEGPSLLDHLTSLQERSRRMPEADIWQVVVAVVLALNYIHVQKRIIHRDLTPGNIVLGQGAAGLRHTKIADFGLAKCLSTGSITRSVVGTMPYTCPEIIQQEQYSEKADIWSLGCCIFHCMMLRPPFEGSNPLSMASKIVEGTYDPLQDPPGGPAYSDALKQLVTTLLTTDPNRRPSIEMVAAGLAGRLMGQLDAMHSAEEVLVRQLTAERRHRRASWDLSSRKIDAYRKLAHLQHGQLQGGSSCGSDTTSQPASPSLRRPSSTWSDAPISPPSTFSPPLGSPGGVPLAAIAHGMLPAGGAMNGSSVGGGQGGPARTVSIPQSRLRSVADPGAQILQQLHKVMWVEQLPPGLNRDSRRRVIEIFRRNLFSSDSSPGSIKMHLMKLTSGDPEVIRGASGPLDFGGSSPVGPSPHKDGCLSYLLLQQMLEALLDEKGYYKAAVA